MNSIIERITLAFGTEPPPKAVLGALRSNSAYEESNEAARKFQGLTWTAAIDLNHDTQFASPYLLNPTAFQYFLPAFLIQALNDPSGNFADSLVEFLRVPNKTKTLTHFCSKFKDLTGTQRAVVGVALLAIIQACPESDYMDRVQKRTEESVERFWNDKSGKEI